jgi:hypothetical protein
MVVWNITKLYTKKKLLYNTIKCIVGIGFLGLEQKMENNFIKTNKYTKSNRCRGLKLIKYMFKSPQNYCTTVDHSARADPKLVLIIIIKIYLCSGPTSRIVGHIGGLTVAFIYSLFVGCRI